MGTVVEKIRYIAGTKSAIRSAILKKGVEVGDEVTFRAYAEKIAEIEGGQSAAAYVFENSTQDGEFPLNALTSDKVQTYQDDESLKTWLETPTKDPAYMVLAADNINAFDKNVETYTGHYKIVWKFQTAVKARIRQLASVRQQQSVVGLQCLDRARIFRRDGRTVDKYGGALSGFKRSDAFTKAAVSILYPDRCRKRIVRPV